jgi:hypothetical protein
MSMANAIMDLVLMVLLLAALGFGVRLDKRLKALRAGQEAFANAVRDLDAAAIRAHNSLRELRADADESQELLHGRVMAAREALNRLESQIARAERAQIDLDKGLSAWETASALRAAPAPSSPARLQPAERPAPSRQDDLVFQRDMINSPLTPSPLEPRRSRAADILAQPVSSDEGEMLDKVQMSELVVANLNEMIRALTEPQDALPSQSQPQSQSTIQPRRQRMPSPLDDDLFGDLRAGRRQS